MTVLKQLLSKRYRLITLLVIIACGVMIRLGFWQLERLAQRQARNGEIAQNLAEPPLIISGEGQPDDLERRKFQPVVVRGVFDHSQEVALQNQTWRGEPGLHLITPLVIEGSRQEILVDRGWIPFSAAGPEEWAKFRTAGRVEIAGMIQLSQPRPHASSLVEPELNIFRVDIDRLQSQISYQLLPVFILQSPTADQVELPYRREPDIVLGNGSHMGYAIQWFSFALMLVVGYLVFVRQQSQPAIGAEARSMSISGEA